MAAILLVEDDDLVRHLVCMLLEGNGHEVLEASNGLEGLMLYSSYRADLDLVLTDVDMPQMNGLELTDRIRARDPQARILLMSGRAFDFPDGYKDLPLLAKPFHPDQLTAVINHALAS